MVDFDIFLKRHKQLQEVILPKIINEDFERYCDLLKEYNFLDPLVIIINEFKEKSIDLETLSLFLESETNEEEIIQMKLEVENTSQEIALIKEKIDDMAANFDKISEPEIDTESIPRGKEDSENTYEKNNTPIGKNRGKKDYEDSLKKLQPKVWSLIRDNWIKTLSSQIDPTIPLSEDEQISKLPGFEKITNEIIYDENTIPLNHSLNTVFKKKLIRSAREITIRQALYSFHKASHIISSGEIHSLKGIKSWSLASCYQGAYLAAKSIINLFGVSLNEFKGQEYLVDVWQTDNIEDIEIEVGIIRYSYRRIEHRHVWLLLKRILNSSTVEIWNERYVNTLKKIDIENFPKQRNLLHYFDTEWIFDDLFEFEPDTKFGVYPEGLEYGLHSFTIKSDYTLACAQILLKFAYDLIKDISSVSNLIKQDFDIINTFLSNDERHPIFIQNHEEFKKKVKVTAQ